MAIIFIVLYTDHYIASTRIKRIVHVTNALQGVREINIRIYYYISAGYSSSLPDSIAFTSIFAIIDQFYCGYHLPQIGQVILCYRLACTI